jgi:hypothetical protein
MHEIVEQKASEAAKGDVEVAEGVKACPESSSITASTLATISRELGGGSYYLKT